MKRILLLVALLAAVSLAEKTLVSFRLKKDPKSPMRGWMVSYDDDGFRFERFGRGGKMRVRWDDLVEEDRKDIRLRLKLELSEDEKLGLIDGHRIHLVGGGWVDGLLERKDNLERHWVRRAGFLFPYPGDRVDRIEDIKVPENEVFSEDEVYLRRMERIPPRTPSQHRQFADALYELGNLEKAREHYELAMQARPDWNAKLAGRMTDIDRLLDDELALGLLKKVRVTYRLHKDYAKARYLIDAFLLEHPDRKRTAMEMLDDLEERHEAEQLRRFHFVKCDEFRRLVEKKMRTQPDLDAALSWATAELPDLLRKRIEERMELDPDKIEEFCEQRAKSSPHWAAYGTGSFIFNKRARKGTPTKKSIRGDPDRWWSQYSDVATRSNLIRAYAAERLPKLFEVVEVRTPTCEKCGGTGRIKHMSVRPLDALSGGHEWFQLCPRCFGGKRERSVAYR